jgi:hypothetical protein
MVESRMSPVSGQCTSEPDGVLHRNRPIQAVLANEKRPLRGRGGPRFIEGERWPGNEVWQETHEKENATETQEYSAPIRRRSCSHGKGYVPVTYCIVVSDSTEGHAYCEQKLPVIEGV